MSKIAEVNEAVEAGKLKVIENLVREALDSGDDAQAILNDGMIAAMNVVGAKFQRGDIYVPEMLIAAKTMKKGVEILKPKLASGAASSLGKCIIGTVYGDLHDIGKNLVALMIESAGFEIEDLGVDARPEVFIEAIKKSPGVKIVALSCLLTTTMPAMKETVAAIRGACSGSFKIIVGGAPVNESFAREIGADGYSADAAAAADLAKKLAA